MKVNGSRPCMKGNSQLFSSESLSLVTATDAHKLHIKDWFNSADEMLIWGGPNLVYPIKDEAFLQVLGAEHLTSYVLLDDQQELMGFGQFYVRLHRHHLGRLVINPNRRGQGLAKLLVSQLLEEAEKKQSAQGASLFVFRHNTAALKCYLAMGFKEVSYPEKMPVNMQNIAYFVLL